MNSILSSSLKLFAFSAALAFAFEQTTVCHANIFASNLKLNGSKTNITSFKSTPVNIGYSLNEPATAGVTLEILSGTNVVRTLVIQSGQNGTARGDNIVPWDTKDQGGVLLPEGIYSLRITASAVGYDGWTLISSDDRTNNYVFRGTGIAVDQNESGPFNGRVYIANSESGPNADFPGAKPGEYNGVLRFNAGGSPAEEGPVVSDSVWQGFGLSPWHIEVSEDDYVYVNEVFNLGEIYRWDAAFFESSTLQVLTAASFPTTGAVLNGLAIAGAGTNTSIYVAD